MSSNSQVLVDVVNSGLSLGDDANLLVNLGTPSSTQIIAGYTAAIGWGIDTTNGLYYPKKRGLLVVTIDIDQATVLELEPVRGAHNLAGSGKLNGGTATTAGAKYEWRFRVTPLSQYRLLLDSPGSNVTEFALMMEEFYIPPTG